MEPLKFYKLATVALLILNLAMLAFFFFTKPKHPPGLGGLTATDIMKLEEDQTDKFRKFVKQHGMRMTQLSEEQGVLLKAYFNNLLQATNNRPKVMADFLDIEQKKIESVFQHFQEVKSILKEEQLPYFEDFINHALERILPKSGDKRPPHPKKPKE